ncbi:hypothetical protein NSND_61592 [Nitrospira sp. ND1]|nr:hypothetical protein NSND_61592 [Nitrospira sp. ND1]
MRLVENLGSWWVEEGQQSVTYYKGGG